VVTAAVRSRPTAGTTSTPVAQIVTAAESLPSDARGFAANAAYDANPTSTNDNDAAVTIPATASIAMTTLSGSVTTVTSPVAATEKKPTDFAVRICLCDSNADSGSEIRAISSLIRLISLCYRKNVDGFGSSFHGDTIW